MHPLAPKRSKYPSTLLRGHPERRKATVSELIFTSSSHNDLPISRNDTEPISARTAPRLTSSTFFSTKYRIFASKNHSTTK